MKPLKVVVSLFSSAEILGYVPPSLLFQHGHGYSCAGKQRRLWDANQLPCWASRDVAPLGADVVPCKVPLLVGTLDVRG